MALLIHSDRLLPLSLAVDYFAREINIAHRKQTSIYIVVDRTLVQHNVSGIICADVVDRLSLPDQRSNDIVYSSEFFGG